MWKWHRFRNYLRQNKESLSWVLLQWIRQIQRQHCPSSQSSSCRQTNVWWKCGDLLWVAPASLSIISLMWGWSNTQWRVWWENKSGWRLKSECKRGLSLWGCEMEMNREQKAWTYHKGEVVFWNAHCGPGHTHCHSIAHLFPRCTSLTDQPVATNIRQIKTQPTLWPQRCVSASAITC